MSILKQKRPPEDSGSNFVEADSDVDDPDARANRLQQEFPWVDLEGWDVETYEDDVIKLRSTNGRGQTGLVHYAPWMDFSAFGYRLLLREQWKTEVVCTDTNTLLHAHTFESKYDAVEDLFVRLAEC